MCVCIQANNQQGEPRASLLIEQRGKQKWKEENLGSRGKLVFNKRGENHSLDVRTESL